MPALTKDVQGGFVRVAYFLARELGAYSKELPTVRRAVPDTLLKQRVCMIAASSICAASSGGPHKLSA